MINSKLLAIPVVLGCIALAGYGIVKLAERVDDSDIQG